MKYKVNGFLRLRGLKLFGTNVYFHWTTALGAIVVALSYKEDIIQALVGAISFVSMIIIHECGHAVFARRLGYSPVNIYVSGIGGLCEYDMPDSQRDEAVIAWGGVVAQFVVAVPLVVFLALYNAPVNPAIGVVVTILGIYSLIYAALNLLPLGNLDGNTAWKLVGITISERRRARNSLSSNIIRLPQGRKRR